MLPVTAKIALHNVNRLIKLFMYRYIELLVLKGDLAEEGSYLYDARETTAWN